MNIQLKTPFRLLLYYMKGAKKVVKKQNAPFCQKKCFFLQFFLKNLLKLCFLYDKIYLSTKGRYQGMKISDIRFRIVKKDDSKLKAVASVTFDDCFVVHDIKVIEGKEGYFIAMPSRKTNDGEYKDIAHPIKTEMREELIKAILSAFETEKDKVEED